MGDLIFFSTFNSFGGINLDNIRTCYRGKLIRKISLLLKSLQSKVADSKTCLTTCSYTKSVYKFGNRYVRAGKLHVKHEHSYQDVRGN